MRWMVGWLRWAELQLACLNGDGPSAFGPRAGSTFVQLMLKCLQMRVTDSGVL